MKKREKKPEDTGTLWLTVMCQLLKGGAIAAVMAVIGLLLGSVLVSNRVISEGWMDRTVLAICVLSALIGGWSIGKRPPCSPLFMGVGVGVILFLILLSAGLLFYEEASISNGGASLLACCCCGGALSGIFRGKAKKKRKR